MREPSAGEPLNAPDPTDSALSDIKFLTHDDPPPLSPGTARALLKVLLKAHEAEEQEQKPTLKSRT